MKSLTTVALPSILIVFGLMGLCSANAATTAAGAVAPPDCVKTFPTKYIGYGPALRDKLAQAAAASFVVNDKTAVSIGHAAFVYSTFMSLWNGDYTLDRVAGSLDWAVDSAHSAKNVVDIGLVGPIIETIDLAYQTMPEPTARGLGAVLNPALAMVNPKAAAVLCEGLGLPTVLPPPTSASSAAYPDKDIDILIFGKPESGAGAVPGFIAISFKRKLPDSVKMQEIANGKFAFGDILIGDGSAFQSRLGTSYADVIAGKVHIRDVLKDAAASLALASRNVGSTKLKDFDGLVPDYFDAQPSSPSKGSPAHTTTTTAFVTTMAQRWMMATYGCTELRGCFPLAAKPAHKVILNKPDTEEKKIQAMNKMLLNSQPGIDEHGNMTTGLEPYGAGCPYHGPTARMFCSKR